MDDGEVPPVECGDFGDGETLCSGHDRGVDGAERKIAVAGDEFSDA